jgi:hypothetical protein
MSKPVNGLRVSPESVAHPLPTDTCQTDPNLALIVDAWDKLPASIRAAMIAMVKSCMGAE